ncbi:ATP-binding cassette domain-containing protein, partial [Escherichia coli]
MNEREARKPDTAMKADMYPVALETQDLSFRYDSQSAPVFSNLNISIKPGESVAITGASGSGKTTLMKVLCGLLVPES